MVLLLCVLNVFQILFTVKQLLKNTTQRFAPRLDGYEWQAVGESVGKHLGQWATSSFGTSPLNKRRILKNWYQYPVTLAIFQSHKSLQHAGAWPMPSEPCATLFSALKGKRRSLIWQQKTGTAAILTLVTGTEAAVTPMTGRAAEPENQLVPVSVASIYGKKYWM